jgi:Uma2 family endonuclease
VSIPATSKFWTYEKYRQLPDDGIRYEVIHGELLMTPSPSPTHQTLSRRLQFVFYQLEQQGQGQIFNAPIDLMIPGGTPVQPDLVFLRQNQAHLVTSRGIEGVPELVVEILSPSTATVDRTKKLHLYAAAGVRRYLLLDPGSQTMEILLHDGEGYRLEASLGPEDRSSLDDYGVVLDMPTLFQGFGPGTTGPTAPGPT